MCYTTQSEQHAFRFLNRARRARPVKGRQANIVIAGNVQKTKKILLPQETNKKRLLNPSSESIFSLLLSIHPKSTGISLVLMTQPPFSLNSYFFLSPSSESNSSKYNFLKYSHRYRNIVGTFDRYRNILGRLKIWIKSRKLFVCICRARVSSQNTKTAAAR